MLSCSPLRAPAPKKKRETPAGSAHDPSLEFSVRDAGLYQRAPSCKLRKGSLQPGHESSVELIFGRVERRCTAGGAGLLNVSWDQHRRSPRRSCHHCRRVQLLHKQRRLHERRHQAGLSLYRNVCQAEDARHFSHSTARRSLCMSGAYHLARWNIPCP